MSALPVVAYASDDTSELYTPAELADYIIERPVPLVRKADADAAREREEPDSISHDRMLGTLPCDPKTSLLKRSNSFLVVYTRQLRHR